ncbi:MAG: NDP-sugar synthase [Nitrospinae bacterium]|nr:NDP-sugar synthase [Nitrospinota bacterium]
MKGMILAAGYGERLRPETDTRPKPLFPIGQTNMIRNAIGYLARHGITEIAINLHHLGHMIKEELSNHLPPSLKIHFIEEKVIMGTGGGIKGAEPYLNGSDFVVINSDVLVNLDLHAVIEFHREKNALATLVVRQNPAPEKIGVLEAAGDGKLIRFLTARAPGHSSQHAPLMFTGIHLFRHDFFQCIPGGRPVNISTEVYAPLVSAGAELYTYRYDGYWADIGTPETYRAASEDVQQGRFTPYGI